MFDDTIIKILGNSYVNTPIKEFEGDFQDYTSTIDKNEYSYICTKLLFVDYIEPLILKNTYLNVNNNIYKVIKVDTYSEHMEVYLFLINLKDIKVNDINKKVLIEETTEKIVTQDEKLIVSDFEIKSGDYVDFQDNKWLITSEITTSENEYRGRIRKCNTNLRYRAVLDGADTVITIPTIADKSVVSISEGKFFNTLDNSITCQVGYSMFNFIKPIIPKFRFIVNGNAWSVEGIDNTTNVLNKFQGTISIKMQSTLIDPNTNEEVDELPVNNPKPIITTPLADKFTIGLLVVAKDMEQDKTFQIVSTCKNNDTVIISPVLTYTSENTNIATVDGNGIITSKNVGTTIVKVKFEDAEAIITINVVALSLEVYHIDGNDTVDATTTQRFTVMDKDGIPSPLVYNWSVESVNNGYSFSSCFNLGDSGDNYLDLLSKSVKSYTDYYGNVYDDTLKNQCGIIKATCSTDTSLIYRKEVWNVLTIPIYDMTLPSLSADVILGQTQALLSNATRDGIADTRGYHGIKCISENESICKISYDSWGGKPTITAISLGTTTVTVSYHQVMRELTVNIIEKVEIAESEYSISGAETLDNVTKQIYTVTDKNGVPSTLAYAWHFETIGSLKYSFFMNPITMTANSITVLGKSDFGGSFMLRATDKLDATKTYTFAITTIVI